MKFKNESRYKHEEKRRITFFALFPVTIEYEVNEKKVEETRWLEKVTVEEEYSKYSSKWLRKRFVD